MGRDDTPQVPTLYAVQVAALFARSNFYRREAMEVLRQYEAAVQHIGRNPGAGRGGKTVFIDDAGGMIYAELAERVERAGK